MVDRKFSWTVEMQIKAARANLTTPEIPGLYRCRIGAGKISDTISGTIKAGSEILFLIARYGFARNSFGRVPTDCGCKTERSASHALIPHAMGMLQPTHDCPRAVIRRTNPLPFAPVVASRNNATLHPPVTPPTDTSKLPCLGTEYPIHG